MSTQTVLGLETSCDETAASVVRLDADGRATVLSSVIASQIAEHAPFGGVVPEIAARAHVESIDGIASRAMAEAGVTYDELSGVAATAGPGLVGGVMVGLSFGKAVALARDLPLVAVNHLEGHAVSARLGAEGRYWLGRLLVRMAGVLEQEGREDEAREAWRLVAGRGLPGAPLARARLGAAPGEAAPDGAPSS